MVSKFLHPKFWPTWAGIFLLYLCSRLPLSTQYPLGRSLGTLLFYCLPSRRRITTKNIQLAFPELSSAEQTQLVKQVFHENSIGLLEAAYSWWNSPKSIMQHVDFHGFDLIERALQQQKGVLLIGAHFANLEIAALMVGHKINLDVTYRKQNNVLMNTIIANKRQRYFNQIIERSDLRTFLKNLKNNHVIWYAPDQDYGAQHSVFADFFGVKAATVKATSKLLRFNHSPALFLTHQRDNNNRYQIKVSEFSQPLTSGDEQLDAQIINHKIEQEIRAFPAQYMWTHRRYKSRPNGEQRFY